MHSNTSTASILYGYTPSKSSPPSSPSKMKRTKSKLENLNEDGDEVNTAFYCVSPEKCDCFCCKLCDDKWCHIEEVTPVKDGWTYINEVTPVKDDWNILFPMD